MEPPNVMGLLFIPPIRLLQALLFALKTFAPTLCWLLKDDFFVFYVKCFEVCLTLLYLRKVYLALFLTG